MRQRTGALNGLLIFLVYGMFALFSLFLVVIGAQVYRRVVATGRENTTLRTSFSYIANKVRMCGQMDAVSLQEHDGVQVLTLREEMEGTDYETRIYFYDGALWEQLALADDPFAPELGELIAELEGFSMRVAGPGVLHLATKGADGAQYTMHLHYLTQESEADQ